MKVWLGELGNLFKMNDCNSSPDCTTSFWLRLERSGSRNQKDTVESGISFNKNSPEKNCLSVGKNNWFSVSGDEFLLHKSLVRIMSSSSFSEIVYVSEVVNASSDHVQKFGRTGLIHRVKIYFVIMKPGLIKLVNNFFIEIAGNDLGFNEVVLFKKRTTLQE